MHGKEKLKKKKNKMNDKKNTQNLKYPIKYEYHFINRKNVRIN